MLDEPALYGEPVIALQAEERSLRLKSMGADVQLHVRRGLRGKVAHRAEGLPVPDLGQVL